MHSVAVKSREVGQILPDLRKSKYRNSEYRTQSSSNQKKKDGKGKLRVMQSLADGLENHSLCGNLEQAGDEDDDENGN